MVVVSSREFRDNQKKFFDMAQVQRVLVKRRNQYVELVPRGVFIPESQKDDTSFREEIKKELRESILEIKAHMKGEVELPRAEDIEF